MSYSHENLAREILANLEKRRAASANTSTEAIAQPATKPATVVKKKVASDVERRMRAALNKLQNLG